jgi:protein-S-isoprenylcysteine O-methyltransferase Ste14
LAQLVAVSAHRFDRLPCHQRRRFDGTRRRGRLRRRADRGGQRPDPEEAKVIEPVPALCEVWVQTVGIVVATVGIAATVYAQLEMGDSWRIGVDQRETTTLVHTGVFRRIRNPIYAAMSTFGIGIALVTPNVAAWAGVILLVATVELQVRRVEEPYLLRTHGDAYRAYAASVGRFVPGVGLIR